MISSILILISYLISLYVAYNVLFKLKIYAYEGFEVVEAKIAFFHIPSGLTAYLAFTVTFILSLLYLKNKNLKNEVLAYSSAKLGTMFTFLTLASGIIWSKLAWGAYWHWDPRQTTVLILFLAFLAYIFLRNSIENISNRARISSIYAIVAYFMVPISYLSARMFGSLHPKTGQWSMDPIGIFMLLLMMISFILLYIALLRIEYKINLKVEGYG